VEALVAEYEASGVTRKTFCAGRGLSEATLDLYRKRAANAAQPGRLLTVEVTPSAARILPEAQACTLAWCLTVASVVTPKAAIRGHFKTGQWEVLRHIW